MAAPHCALERSLSSALLDYAPAGLPEVLPRASSPALLYGAGPRFTTGQRKAHVKSSP